MRPLGSFVLIGVFTGCSFDATVTGDSDAGRGGAGGEPCLLGETRACGDCFDGVQTCELVDEFADWGTCEGASPDCAAISDPTEELPVPVADPGDPVAPPEEPVLPSDPPPSDPPPGDPPPGDPPSPSDPPPTTTSCAGPEICRNGVDDDCDYDTDCEDSDCAEECAACFHECEPGATRWCNSPDGCRWGQQLCNPDRTWGTCHETMGRPTGCEAFPKYDTACCDASTGACCEDWPFLGSVGECTTIVPCWDWP
jgi:hypothetical protein